MTGARREWRTKAALTLTSTAFALLLAEVAVRMLGLVDPVLRDVDPVLGWAPIAGAEGWWTREGRAHVRITEHGFRGVDAPPQPRPGVLRIAVIGDSYTEAKQVALEDTYSSLLEPALDRCSDEPVEVLTFGVSGFGTAQEHLLWRHRVAAYQPDVVLLAFVTGNDISDNHPALRMNNDPSPYYEVRDGQLLVDDAFTRSDAYRERAAGGAGWTWLGHRSQLVRLVMTRVRHLGRGAARGELGLSEEIYSPPRDDTWRDAWARTEAILEQTNRDVRATGARFFVVTLSNAAQVDPDPSAREQFLAEIDGEDLLYPDRRVAAVGARAGFAVLNLVPSLRAHAEAHRVQLHGFPNTAMGTGHWNEAGHRVAAQHLSEWLCTELAEAARTTEGSPVPP